MAGIIKPPTVETHIGGLIFGVNMRIINIIIDNYLRINQQQLSTRVVTRLRSLFTHRNPQINAFKAMGIPWWNLPVEISTWKEENGEILLPRGGLGRVRECLKSFELGWNIIDKRTEGIELSMPIPAMKTVLRDYQTRLVNAAIAKQNCLIQAPVGSGKTTVALAIASKLNLPTLVIVHNRGLFDQWIERVQSEMGLSDKDIGYIQGKQCIVKPITIAMQKTLATRDVSHLAMSFGVVICDEVHFFSASSFISAVEPFHSKYRLGVSADVTRKDKKEFLIYDIFGDVVDRILPSDLIMGGHIHDVEARVIETDFEAPWYGISQNGAEEKEIDFPRLLDEMDDDENRERLVIDVVRREVSNGESVLVMTHRRDRARDYLQILQDEGIRAGLMIGGDTDRKEFESTRAGMVAGTVDVAVGTYQAISTGLDMPRVTSVVCATPVASNKQLFNQIRGRVCRTSNGKTGARLFYLWDKAVYPGHIRNLRAWCNRVTFDQI